MSCLIEPTILNAIDFPLKNHITTNPIIFSAIYSDKFSSIQNLIKYPYLFKIMENFEIVNIYTMNVLLEECFY